MFIRKLSLESTMKINPSAALATTKPKQPLLPLVPVFGDMDMLPKERVIKHILYSDPTDSTSEKYIIICRILFGDEHLRDVFRWRQQVINVIAGQRNLSGRVEISAIESMLREAPLAVFRSKIDSTAN